MPVLRVFHIAFCCLLIALSAPAQQVTVTELPTQTLLPVAHIHRIFQDSEGYMWYATEEGGLCRDNGYQLDIFRSDLNTPHLLASNTITCIAEDKNRRIWFGTEKGLYILDKANYQITEMTGPEVAGRRIHAVCATTDNTLWVAADNEILHYDADGTLQRTYPSLWEEQPKPISDFYEDSQHILWILQAGGGLLKYDLKARTPQSPAPVEFRPETYKLPNLSPTQMIEDKQNHCYWIGTWGGGIIRYAPSEQPAMTEAATDARTRRLQVLGLLQDSNQGLLWVSAMDNLYLYRIADQTLQPVATQTFLPEGSKILDRIIEDRWGNIWVPGYSPHTFILSFERNEIVRYPVSAMTAATGYPVMADRVVKEGDHYWIWQGRTGLTLYDSTRDRISFVSDFPEISTKHTIAKPIKKCRNRAGIWAFHANSLLHVWHEEMRMCLDEEVRLPDDSPIHSLYEDEKNCLWIGAGESLYQYATLGGKLSKVSEDVGRIQDLVATDGCTYCITGQQQWIMVHADGTRSIIKEGEDYSSIARTHDGRIWVASLQGSVYAYDPHTQTVCFEEEAANRNGDGVKGLAADDLGHLWVLSDQYVKEYNPANRSFRILRNTDRTILVDYFHCISRMENGRMNIGGIGAFCELPPLAELNRTSDGTKTLVSAWETNDTKHLAGIGQSQLSIEPEESNLAIYFSTLNHLYARKISYAYRLKGWEKAWTYLPQGVNVAHFSKLPKGKYTLEVKATDIYGCWGKPTDVLTLHRLPAWYETRWAYILYFCTGLVLLLGIWWMDSRIRYLITLQKKRKEIFLATGAEVQTENLPTSAPDKELLAKAVACVKRNMDNSDYNVERLSEDLCMSRMSLYRKLQLQTGQKPTEFIRSIRLKEAARLLNETQLSVVEISERVGFSTPGYFSKCFKEMFGVLPTHYGKRE
ncbi:MAG: two-component regulator propeller domain-containing protein [Bacteroides sp.]|nr:two-component regulator propeller domain-containing protein [Bacteroides sp.]